MVASRVMIRLGSERDAADIIAIYAPIVTDTAISFELNPPSLAEMQQRIASTHHIFPWLVCEEGGRVVGYAHASAHRARPAYRWSTDVSVYVANDVRERGNGRRSGELDDIVGRTSP